MVNKMQAEMPAFYSLLSTGISLPIFYTVTISSKRLS